MAYNFVYQVRQEIRRLAKQKGIIFNDDSIARIIKKIIDDKVDIVEAINEEIEKEYYHITRDRKPYIKEKEKKQRGRKKMESKNSKVINFTDEEIRFLEYLKEKHNFTTLSATIKYCINQQRQIKRNFT